MAAFVMVFMSIGIVAAMIGVMILRGGVLSILWAWFAVPIFGLPAIGIAQALGISITISLLTHQYVPPKDKDNWTPVVTAFLTPLFALRIGWIVKGYL